ncbi:MAG: Sip1-related alpha-galactosidase [Candidatus Bipolaricaulaceae bacterium]
MSLKIAFGRGGRPEVWLGDQPWLWDVGIWLPGAGGWLRDGEGELDPPTWEQGGGGSGGCRVWLGTYARGGQPLVRLTVRQGSDWAWTEAEPLAPLTGLAREDACQAATFLAPAFAFRDDLRFLLCSFGLGAAGEPYPGGSWPTAAVGTGPGQLPAYAFAPLVLFSPRGALAVAPASHFLTSPLVRIPGGAARGLHGAVDRLPAGVKLATVFAAGSDPAAALGKLGQLLRGQGGRRPPAGGDQRWLHRLGWWNAYGSYYTELLRRLDARALQEVVDGLRAQAVPVAYLGLDLWYPYARIGQARRFRPDRRKYPQGLRPLAERAGLPLVLHLSSLAEDNEYQLPGGDPAVYEAVARELEAEGAIAAWHDWLRTQQHLTPSLRADPLAAERWFSGMAESLAGQGLAVLLCMQTMGMNLAATAHPNVVAARTHTDFLFSQRAALEQAHARGHSHLLEAWVPPWRLRQQNLLMGSVLHGLGLAPFHDLFLSRPHPGLGGEAPQEDAALRALSCGPVGLGDRPGMCDAALVRRLLLPDGTVARPDRPPAPLPATLGKDVQAFWTHTDLGEGERWGFLVLLNTGSEELPYRLDPPLEGDVVVWDVLGRQLRHGLVGRLPPGGLAYLLVAPVRHGVAPLGQWDQLVPIPSGRWAASAGDGGWRLRGAGGKLALWSPGRIRVSGDGGRLQGVERQGELWLCEAGADTWLRIRGR